MELAKQEGIILRRLFLLPKKTLLGLKEEPLTFTEIIESICREENLSFGYTKRIIMRCIKNGMIVFSHSDKIEGRKRYYSINKKEIIKELEKDKIYQLDEMIEEDLYSIRIR